MTNTGALIDEIATLQDAMAATEKRLWELKCELRDFMLAKNAKRLPHAVYEITLKPGKTVYDANMVRAKLGETLGPEELTRLIHERTACPQCGGTGKRAPYVDGTHANVIRRFGDQYAAALDAAIVTKGDATVEIKRRETK